MFQARSSAPSLPSKTDDGSPSPHRGSHPSKVFPRQQPYRLATVVASVSLPLHLARVVEVSLDSVGCTGHPHSGEPESNKTAPPRLRDDMERLLQAVAAPIESRCLALPGIAACSRVGTQRRPSVLLGISPISRINPRHQLDGHGRTAPRHDLSVPPVGSASPIVSSNQLGRVT